MEIVDRRIPLSQIGKTVGPSPVQRFFGNVKRHGVVVPVLLQEVVGEGGEIEYHIIDGNRRVSAARKAGLQDVPARVFAGISADDAARLTLASNNFRSENDITEFWAIKHLERSGVPRRRIATDAGLTIKSLDLRNRWSTLDRRIFVGYANGHISATVAKKISRLPQEDQRVLGDLFARRGRLQTDDVEALYRPSPEPPPSPVYENDIPVGSPSYDEAGNPALTLQYSTERDIAFPVRDQDLRPSYPAAQAQGSGQEQLGSLSGEVRSRPASDNTVQSSRLESLASVEDVFPSPSIVNSASKNGSQSQRQIEPGVQSVKIVTTSATSEDPLTWHRQRVEGLDRDVQQAIDHLARLGCSRRVALDDVVNALTVAYRQMEFTAKVTKGSLGGGNH